MIKTITVSWFSAGVSSAVATWLMRDQLDKIIYTHIDDQHPDTMRFVRDCETWFGKPVEVLQSPAKTVAGACGLAAFIRGPHGAACSRILKRRVRKEWEVEHCFFNTFRYVWGMDANEFKREQQMREDTPEYQHIFPLLDYHITKEEAHGILANAGIKRPAMYDLGYRNNNCIGCVRGGMWYWNKIRRDFPEVFKERSEMERIIGASILRRDKQSIFLDELDQTAGREEDEVMPECGAMCESLKLEKQESK